MAPIVEADRNASNNTHSTTNNTLNSSSSSSSSSGGLLSGDSQKPTTNSNSNNNLNHGGSAEGMSYSINPTGSIPGDTNSGASERPTISLITGIPPMNKSASGLSSNPSSALLTPSTAASTAPVSSIHKSSSPSDMRTPLPNLSFSLGEKSGSPAGGSLPSLSESTAGYNRNSLPSFHHQTMYPPSSSQSQALSSPFPSPDVMSSRREEYMHRPFTTYTQHGGPDGSSEPFDGSELDDDARSRKRYGRPPGAKDKRPRRRRTKAQMEEDALIYGYRDSESVYHSPTSVAKRRRLSPRRDSIGESPDEETESPQSQSAYTYPAYNSFLLATRDPNIKEPYHPHPAPPQSTQPSPTNSFNPYLHRHHLPMSSNPPSALPSLRGVDGMPAPRTTLDSPWGPRRPEGERISGTQIPDSKPGIGDFGPSRHPPSPVGPSGFSSINVARPPEAYRPPPPHVDHHMEPRGRDPTPRRPSPPPDYRRDRENRWDGSAPPPPPSASIQQPILPRLGELPRLSDLPLERPRWERVEDVSRKPEYDNRIGANDNMHKMPSMSTGHILNGPPLDRKIDNPNTNRPSVSDMLRPEQPSSAAPLQVTGSDRPILQERSGSITSISVGPSLEADTSKREEEDTDEQIEEYRAKMLEQHSSYYNCPPGKPRVKREPSYALPSKSPLHEENERLRAALQRYRQQKGIERLKLEEFINKRCNGDQAMIKELLTITGHIAEDDYVGPVKPACL